MSANPTSVDLGATRTGGEAAAAPGSYRELTAHEFEARKAMAVLLIKSPHAVGEFQGYEAVVSLEDCKAVEPYLEQWPRGLPIGLVCPDGDCSGRLAIRLSKRGFTVFHLAGGLREWFQTFPGQARPVA